MYQSPFSLKKFSAFCHDFPTFLEVFCDHTVMTGTAVMELSSAIFRNALKSADVPNSEIVITGNAVTYAIMDIQRMEDRIAGFNKQLHRDGFLYAANYLCYF